jgi:hypothetical protein
MNKATKVTYNGGMNQDLSKSKHTPNIYFEGKNVRIIASDSQSTGSLTNEKGNLFLRQIPDITIEDGVITYDNKTLNYTTSEILNGSSTNQQIIGHSLNRNCFILFTTDNEGIDCIWKLDENSYILTLLYLRNLNFNTSNPIQPVSNFENENIDKVYWVDGNNQLRFININHSIENGDTEELIDLPQNLIEQVGDFTLNQPILSEISGGNHTSGVIQYAYNLYKISGSQTKISPLSETISLDKQILGGGEVNEIVSTTPVIQINNIDPNYTNLRLYAIKYTSYNQTPQVSLILDTDVTDNNQITYYDTGSIIQNISLEEFIFLGSDVIIPQHINSKDNRLFLANYKESNYIVDIDCRAYSFNNTTSPRQARITDSFTNVLGNPLIPVNSKTLFGDTQLYDSIPEKYSAINQNYNIYKYDLAGNIGGEGKYIKYNIIRTTNVNNLYKKTFFKDYEIYRLGIQFYNKKGQVSLPKWIADTKIHVSGNQNNLNGYFAGLQITLKSEFYVWLNNNSNFLNENGVYDENLKPIGYKILRADRTELDKTIICQGLINPMVSIAVGGDSGVSDTGMTSGITNPNNIIEANNGIKIPSLVRRFDNYLNPMFGADNYAKLDRLSEGHPNYQDINSLFVSDSASREVYKSSSSSGWIAGTFQFNSLMQLFSPEIIFNSVNNISNNKLQVIGGIVNNNNQYWGQERNKDTKEIITEGKTNNSISPWDVKAIGVNVEEIQGSIENLQRWGMFSTPENENRVIFNQLYREYDGIFKKSITNSTDLFGNVIPNGKIYNFNGQPLVVEKGQGRTLYNNNSLLSFTNSLEPLITDTGAGSDSGTAPLLSVNSWGAKNLTFALSTVPGVTQPEQMDYYDILYSNSLIGDSSIGLIGEVTIPYEQIYIGNIYGGNLYESKKRTNYIEIGEYQLITENVYNLINPGDTFINNFQFTKICKTDTEIYDRQISQFTEIVNVRLETTVDLENRNDISFSEWDAIFQPRYDDYQKYNRVYSQQPNLFYRRDLNYNTKLLNKFDTNIISTKLKSPGELIDSWTDLQQNEVLTLDGKYGPITHLNNFKDEIYAFQNNALAFISINPRVQVQASDGVAVELGFGRVLQEYKYRSVDSGTINKWSVVNTPNTFYYYDYYNRSIRMFNNDSLKISDIKGLHSFLDKNLVESFLKDNNPILRRGVTSTYDYINNDMFMTFLQDDKSFTISYNELSNSFVSFYDYLPSMYISRGFNLLAIHPDNNRIYKQYDGDYNIFFDEYYPSYITLIINPETDLDCVFDNIQFKSELYLNDIDQPDKTLTHIQAFNEYQNSGLISLEVGRNKNLRRKFRDWHALIPRDKRNRIRNPWIFLKLQLENEDNYKMILHDINVYYTV